MPTDKSQQRDELPSTIRNTLRRAELYCAKTRRWDTRLLIISIICGAAATVLAGGTVIGGPVCTGGNWRLADSLFDCCRVHGLRHRCRRPSQKFSDYDPSFQRREVRRTPQSTRCRHCCYRSTDCQRVGSISAHLRRARCLSSVTAYKPRCD